MNHDNNKGPGSDLKFVWWDDLGDSQDHVDKQATPCSNHAIQQEEDEEEAERRMMIIMRNGNTGEHYPEYEDYMDDSNEE